MEVVNHSKLLLHRLLLYHHQDCLNPHCGPHDVHWSSWTLKLSSKQHRWSNGLPFQGRLNIGVVTSWKNNMAFPVPWTRTQQLGDSGFLRVDAENQGDGTTLGSRDR